MDRYKLLSVFGQTYMPAAAIFIKPKGEAVGLHIGVQK